MFLRLQNLSAGLSFTYTLATASPAVGSGNPPAIRKWARRAAFERWLPSVYGKLRMIERRHPAARDDELLKNALIRLVTGEEVPPGRTTLFS